MMMRVRIKHSRQFLSSETLSSDYKSHCGLTFAVDLWWISALDLMILILLMLIWLRVSLVVRGMFTFRVWIAINGLDRSHWRLGVLVCRPHVEAPSQVLSLSFANSFNLCCAFQVPHPRGNMWSLSAKQNIFCLFFYLYDAIARSKELSSSLILLKFYCTHEE